MKKLKTLISVVLSAMLVLSLVVPSMADGYSVTLNGGLQGESYSLYKIFNFISQPDAPTEGVYTASSSIYDLLNNAGYASTGVKFSEDVDNNTEHAEHYVLATDFDAKKLSEFLHNNVKSLGTAIDTQTAPASGTINFENVDSNGYYFIDTTAGSLFILDTTTPNMVVTEKNQDVKVEKQVSDNANSGWASSNNAQIGDTVYFKTTVTIPKGSKNVVLHDIMEAGLTLTPNSVVAVGLTKTTDYSVNYSPAEHDNQQCTFELTFTQAYLNSLTAKTTDIVVTYNAVLNENATCGDDTNDNKTKVKYGDNSWTAESTTRTVTLDVNLKKVDESGKELPNAEFKLHIKDGAEVPVVLESTGVYRVAVGEEEGVLIIAGNVRIEGLDFDKEYVLTEEKAPVGYNRVNGPIDIEKSEEEVDFLDNEVENKTGTELPDTGSTGTKVLFTVGGIMMVVAFVLFTSKRRMAAED